MFSSGQEHKLFKKICHGCVTRLAIPNIANGC